MNKIKLWHEFSSEFKFSDPKEGNEWFQLIIREKIGDKLKASLVTVILILGREDCFLVEWWGVTRRGFFGIHGRVCSHWSHHSPLHSRGTNNSDKCNQNRSNRCRTHLHKRNCMALLSQVR